MLILRCAGFYGPKPAGLARELKLLARVHRVHSGPTRLLSNSPQSGFYAPASGDVPPSTIHQVHRPHTGSAWLQPLAARVHRPRIRGRLAACCTSRDTGPIKGPGPHDDHNTGAPAPSGQPDITCHCVAPGSSCLINGTRLLSTPSAFSTGFNGPLKRAGPGGGKYAG